MQEISSPRVYPLPVRAIAYEILNMHASLTSRVFSVTGWMISYSIGSIQTTIVMQGMIMIIGCLLCREIKITLKKINFQLILSVNFIHRVITVALIFPVLFVQGYSVCLSSTLDLRSSK